MLDIDINILNNLLNLEDDFDNLNLLDKINKFDPKDLEIDNINSLFDSDINNNILNSKSYDSDIDIVKSYDYDNIDNLDLDFNIEKNNLSELNSSLLKIENNNSIKKIKKNINSLKKRKRKIIKNDNIDDIIEDNVNNIKNKNKIKTRLRFLYNLQNICKNPKYKSIVTFFNNSGIIIFNIEDFQKIILKDEFKDIKLYSFYKMLTVYGFYRNSKINNSDKNKDNIIYINPLFTQEDNGNYEKINCIRQSTANNKIKKNILKNINKNLEFELELDSDSSESLEKTKLFKYNKDDDEDDSYSESDKKRKRNQKYYIRKKKNKNNKDNNIFDI